MKKVFICSPLRGNYKENIKNAKKYSRQVALEGKIPITPHIYFTQFLNDKVLKERNIGIKMGLELMKFCDEIKICGKLSKGMKKKIKYWKKLWKKKKSANTAENYF